MKFPKLSAHFKAQLVRLARLAAFVLVAGGGADALISGAAARLGLSAAVVGVLETTFRQFAKVAPVASAPAAPAADPADTQSLP